MERARQNNLAYSTGCVAGGCCSQFVSVPGHGTALYNICIYSYVYGITSSIEKNCLASRVCLYIGVCVHCIGVTLSRASYIVICGIANNLARRSGGH